MDDGQVDERWLAARFEENRAHLRAVAYRMLGSVSEAEDAVQEAWLRLSRTDTGEVRNLTGWLTRVVARVCLDMLRSRTARREQPLGSRPAGAGSDGVRDEPAAEPDVATDPERAALLADAVGPALLVVLDTLAPDERLAFVLHDLFAVPFDEIAPIVGRSPVAARQLASRARRRVRGADTVADADPALQCQVVQAFLAASRGGDFEALLGLLDPGAVLRADAAAVRTGATRQVSGARAVAGTFSGRARAARAMLVDGAAGLVWAVGGAPRVVFAFTITDGRISAVDMIADPEHLRRLDIAPLDAGVG